MITIITPTIRREGLDIVRKCLENQTIQNFEWLIGSPFDPQMGTWVKDDFEGGFWTFNRINTKLCKEAKGDLIVFWQDNIWISPNGLEKFLVAYGEVKGAISGVGDQYIGSNEYGKPIGKVWNDPRKTDKFGSFYECMPNDWEINWACVGKHELEKVNYFPDQADFVGYGADNVMVAERLEKIGIKFYLDQTNESYTIQHTREKKDWEDNYIMKTDYFKNKKYLV